jgi:hypothetical protein
MSAPHQPSDRTRQAAPRSTGEPGNHGPGRRPSPAEPFRQPRLLRPNCAGGQGRGPTILPEAQNSR